MRTKQRPDAGFSLTALIFFATAASILIAAIVPAYQTQAKREVEQELIFRGGEYTRAIQKYQRRFGVYPTSIDQLVSTNNLRFLRRVYKDPLTGKDFRLILINPDGSLTGSKLTQTQNLNNQSLFGNNTQQFGQGQNNQQQQNNNPNRPTNGLQNTGTNNNTSSFNSSFGGPQGQTQNGNNGTAGGLQSGAFTSNGSSGGFQNLQNQPNNQPVRAGGQTGGSPFGGSSATPGGAPVAGGGIIGVASDDDKDVPIMVYNNRQKYDEWEFIAILGQRGQQQNGQNPQQNQQQNGQRQNNPFSTPNQPFNGPPNGTPTGGNGAAGQNGNFGFGGNQPAPNQPGKLP